MVFVSCTRKICFALIKSIYLTRVIRNEAIEDVKIPNNPLSGDTISEFIKIANANQTKYQLIHNLNGYPGAYAKFREKHRGLVSHLKHFLNIQSMRSINVQIIFDGAPNGNSIGHYVCVCYKSKEKLLYIFDSDYEKGKLLSQTIKNEIVSELFPDVKFINIIKPYTTQDDDTSCGLLAIANAMALMDGHNPEYMEFEYDLSGSGSGDKAIFLREHLVKIFEQQKLIPFPNKNHAANSKYKNSIFGLSGNYYLS